VEQWENEKGMEIILHPKINRIQTKMKKTDPQFQTPTKQR
jgi:hypothetical protein